MVVKMKVLLKGFKRISQIFGFAVHKEQEMEIGFPTDVKHVLHVGSDNLYGSSPSWMSHYKTSPDFSSSSLSNLESRQTSWASLNFDQQREVFQPSFGTFLAKGSPCPHLPKVPKRSNQPKAKVMSPSSARSSRSSASMTSYSTALEDVVVEMHI